MASISVCNQALAEIRAQTIVGIDDGSPEANACAQHYDDCLSTLLETHEWSFAKVRVALAQLGVNDRSSEWVYAYALPNDLGSPGNIVPAGTVPAPGFYYPWPYTFPRPGCYFAEFLIDGETLYTNLASAVFEYSSNDPPENLWPAMFRRALVLDLASRLSITLRDDRAMKGDFIQQHEAAKRRAMADDLNRSPRRDRPIIDEVAWARS